MSSISLGRDGGVPIVPVHFKGNDLVFLEFFRIMSIGMMRQSRTEEDITDQESSILYGCVQNMISQIKDHKDGKRMLSDSKRGRGIIMMESRLEFRDLVKSGQLPPPAIPWKDRTWDDEEQIAEDKDSKQESKVEAEAQANAAVDTEALWPSELSETWQFYPYGHERSPMSTICLRVAVPLEFTQFLMPIKVYASAGGFNGGGDRVIMSATLTSKHHEAVANDQTLSVFAFSPEEQADPSSKLVLVPHKLGFFQPSREQKAFYQDINNDHLWKSSFKDMCSNDPLVRAWPKENERWTLCDWRVKDNHDFKGIRLDSKSEGSGICHGAKMLFRVAAYAWHTRRGK